MVFEKWNDIDMKVIEWRKRTENSRDLFRNFYHDEANRINQLDSKNKSKQLNQLFKILDEVYKLIDLEKQRVKEEIKQDLEQKGVKLLSSEYCKAEIVSLWKDSFLNNFADEELDMCHIDQYLWHIFTYKMINNYVRFDEAEEAFNHYKKIICISFGNGVIRYIM